MAPQKAAKEEDRLSQQRTVILDPAKCKPNFPAWTYFKKHQRECGKDCITVTSVAGKHEIKIWDNACLACLNRAKRCPDNAAKIVQLPANLTAGITHKYGMNAFKLHGLPVPRPGRILGMLGCNGTGKSTALNILAGKLKPNLGCLDEEPKWVDILKHYRGSELQGYFKMLLEDKLTVSLKRQLDQDMVKELKGKKVGDLVAKADERGAGEQLMKTLDLLHLVDREVQELSGGELQRLAITLASVKNASVYIFDEPSSFLDVQQRLVATKVIRELAVSADHVTGPKYVLVVEHDLAVLDFMSDYIHVLYGEPGCYGIVCKRAGLRNGINNFLAGYTPAENMKFRAEALTFKVAVTTAAEIKEGGLGIGGKGNEIGLNEYPEMSKTLSSEDRPSFTIHVEAGGFQDAEVIGLLGENGTGKTTYLEMLAGLHDKLLPQVEGEEKKYDSVPVSLLGMGITMSYKRQDYAPKFRRYKKTVRELFEANLQIAFTDSLFKVFVLRPLRMEELFDLNVSTLSGGELQRLAITVCLGTPANVFLLDEPSAGLDCEQRIIVAKVIKRWIVSHLGRTCFVIEHDCLMMSALADRMILFEGNPGVETWARSPTNVADGFNKFLKTLDVTFRRDPVNHRPRVNKHGSAKDQQQKASGNHFRIDDQDDSDDEK